ncbi:uncharacterized protein LOC110711318 [Chenopodium quinoa]|uniref:uncharacterized protein LOC110711318 n=1 Tax=Chenopodium quinoa TaxID=63459 RepID=UPI000B799A38|nr:uncharacterized protein LOC110711318 [Chenopodium quinoa]
MVLSEQFSRSASEDLIEHLDQFLELCAMMQTNEVSQDYIRMHLFRQSLTRRAKKWLKQVKPNTLTTWREVVKAFLKRFISVEKTAVMRRKIASFEQDADESLGEAWERFKELVQACPHHEYNQGLLMRVFYDGLEPMSRANLDAGAGGQLIKIPQNQVEATIEEVSNNYFSGGRRRNTPKRGGIYELEKVDQLQHQIDQLTRGLSKLNTSVNASLSPEHVAAYNTRTEKFRGSGGGVAWRQPPPEFVPQPQQWNQQAQPFYKSNPQYQNPPPYKPQNPRGSYPRNNQYNNQTQAPQRNHQEKAPQAELTQTQLLQDMHAQMQCFGQQMQEIRAHNKMVDSQLAQLVERTPFNSPSTLPGQSQPNPSHNPKPDTCKAITLRLGTSYKGPNEGDSEENKGGEESVNENKGGEKEKGNIGLS